MTGLGKKTILVIEDDETIADSLLDFLRDNDFEVLYASNGADGLKALQGGARPDLILLDLMMPIMDGFKFRENQLLDPQLRDIPVIVMSADGHVEEKRIRTTAREYIRKPFEIVHLLTLVKRHTAAS